MCEHVCLSVCVQLCGVCVMCEHVSVSVCVQLCGVC